jgi:pimeloyl-ACP methyl ester carboxylesterase
VIAVDRRGRGASGDADEWAVAREFEDVAAVVDAVAERHGVDVDPSATPSGRCAPLEGSLLTPRVRRLVLYEPPILGDGSDAVDDDALPRRFEALLAEGRREELVVTFYREVARMPEDQIELLRSSPAWPGRVAAAHTLPREVFDRTYRFEPARFAALGTPTLLLLGELSPSFFREAARAVTEALPRATAAVLPGQHHIAMDTAPELFVDEVLRFLQA